MNRLSPYQREILSSMGVDVWRMRVAMDVDDEEQLDLSIKAVEAVVDASETTPVEVGQTLAEPAIVDRAPVIQRAVATSEPATNHTKEESALPGLVTRNSNQDVAHPAPGLPTLDDIRLSVDGCQRCGLCENRSQAVAGEGNAHARWMFIGEAPGQNEDLQGRPFVGRSGQLLDAMIAALGMQREDTYITNVLKCRPPANRSVQKNEVAACEPFLHQQIALVQPDVLIALGQNAAQFLLQTEQPIDEIRQQTYQFGERNIPLIATYHPAYLLRSPVHKASTWTDLCRARSLLTRE